MSERSTLIGPLHDALCTYLEGITALEPAKIVRRQKGQPAAMLREAAARVKLGIIVLRPLLKGLNPNLPGPYATEIEITFQVFEHGALNKADLDGPGLLEQLLIAIDGWTPVVADCGFNSLHAAPDSVLEVEDADFDIIEVTYRTSGGLVPRT